MTRNSMWTACVTAGALLAAVSLRAQTPPSAPTVPPTDPDLPAVGPVSKYVLRRSEPQPSPLTWGALPEDALDWIAGGIGPVSKNVYRRLDGPVPDGERTGTSGADGPPLRADSGPVSKDIFRRVNLDGSSEPPPGAVASTRTVAPLPDSPPRPAVSQRAADAPRVAGVVAPVIQVDEASPEATAVMPAAVRRDYIPTTGPSAIRVRSGPKNFDRGQLVALDAFFADRAPKDEAPPALAQQPPPGQSTGVLPELELPPLPGQQRQLTRQELAQQQQQQQPPTPQPATIESVTGSSGNQQPPATPPLGQPLPASATVNPEQILRYFEIRDRARPQSGIGVPFVLPYQSQQPLIMESGVNYQQTAPASGTEEE